MCCIVVRRTSCSKRCECVSFRPLAGLIRLRAPARALLRRQQLIDERFEVLAVGFIATAVFDLKSTIITCPTMTWTSSDPAVASVVTGSAPMIGRVTGISEGRVTITPTCRGVSEAIAVRITEPN